MEINLPELRIDQPHPRWGREDIGDVRGNSYNGWAAWAEALGHQPDQLVCIDVLAGAHRYKIRHRLQQWTIENRTHVADGPLDHLGHEWIIIRRDHLPQVAQWMAEHGWRRSLLIRQLL